MNKCTEQDIFTTKELERWIKSIGGIGTIVNIPDNYYALQRFHTEHRVVKSYLSYLDKDKPCGKVIQVHIPSAWSDFPHVLIKTREVSHNVLWHEMRLEQNKIITPYPITCKRCKSPARRCDGYIFCSNAKCKTRRLIPKFIKVKSKFNFIPCPRCSQFPKLQNGIAINAGPVYKGYADIKIYLLRCYYAHEWQVHIKELKVGDTLNHQIHHGLTYHSVWDGSKWEIVAI